MQLAGGDGATAADAADVLRRVAALAANTHAGYHPSMTADPAFLSRAVSEWWLHRCAGGSLHPKPLAAASLQTLPRSASPPSAMRKAAESLGQTPAPGLPSCILRSQAGTCNSARGNDRSQARLTAPNSCSSPRRGCKGDGWRKPACGGEVPAASVKAEEAERDGWAGDGWAGIQEAVRANPPHTHPPLHHSYPTPNPPNLHPNCVPESDVQSTGQNPMCDWSTGLVMSASDE